MRSVTELTNRIDDLIELAERTLSTRNKPDLGPVFVNTELFGEFRGSVLSFIQNLYGNKHAYFAQFEEDVKGSKEYGVEIGKGILQGIKTELEGGWLNSFKGMVSAEVFSDFLEMATHFLDEGYKDPAAVMIGSILEEHLRQLCTKNGIPLEQIINGKTIPRKADVLNADLTKEGIYNKLDQKNVTFWLGLRNHAAHGKYGEYNIEQVKIMLQGVTEFMSRNFV